ncbi:MAG: hypothetical protein JW883_00860 [Deltaproteobacteria bacterium]|nr:hypothetical protein [Deltaproteobacteria bacterium]
MLTANEVEQIRSGSYTLAELSPFEYIYDMKFGTRYTKNEINDVLQLAGSEHTLTSTDVDALQVDEQFTISKKTLVALGARLFAASPTSNDATKFATLVLLWGYASQGYGSYRVKRIVENRSLQLASNTINSFHAITKHNLKDGYGYWCGENHIRGLGESFFSKILYFLAKVVSSEHPIALIKDATTSQSAASLFGIEILVERNLTSYLQYVKAINLAAEATQMTPERVEEILFSAAPGQCQRNTTSESTLSCGFGFSEAFQHDYSPPVFTNDDYVESGLDARGGYRIMLVGDGKPECGALRPMAYSPETRPLLNGFFSQQRTTVIREANEEANRCSQGTPTYVMTTGYGPVSVTATMNLYNVPGEQAIRLKDYWSLYKRALFNILSMSGNAKKIFIVYYAAVSRRDFREGVFKILQEFAGDRNAQIDRQLYVCMYGARRHPSDRWENLCRIFDSLAASDLQSIRQIQHDWQEAHEGLSAFFRWCWNGVHI